MNNDLVFIGRFVKTHGFKGGLIFRKSNSISVLFKNNMPVYVETMNERVPYFVTGFKPSRGDEYIVQIEDLNSDTDARKICGRDVFAHPTVIRTIKPGIRENIIGFRVDDALTGTIGIVNDVFEIPPQIILQIISDDVEILIPMHEELVVSLDKKNGIIQMNVPEGLVDFYKNGGK